MAIRQATLIVKNSDIVNRPLPSTLLKGEAIVNTADGIMYFSGVTTSTSEWTPAGTGTTANFWEVGSNLYDLRLRNRITEYESISGAGLVGKFLSGTTNGFVLANISAIVGVDTYVTGFTYSNNVATIYQNIGQPPLSILINTMTGLTVNGTLSATTGNIGTSNINTLNATGGTVNTLNSTNIVTSNLTATTANITNLSGISTLSASSITVSSLTANTLNATGATINTLNSTNIVTNSLTANTISATTYLGLPLDIRVTGGTYNAGTATFTNNSGGTFNVTGFTTTDTYVTGYTYNPLTNTFTISQNQGQPNLTALINSVSGFTVNGNLSATTGNINTINSTNIVTSNLTATTANITNLSGISTLSASSITVSSLTANTISATTYLGLPLDVSVTGGTYNNVTGIATFTNNSGGTFGVSGFFTSANDTYVTGFTYSNNVATIKRNQGQPDLSILINTMTGLTVTNLTPGRVVIVGSGGVLTDDAGFTYNSTTNVLSTPVDGAMNIGTGGLIVGSGGSPSVAGTGDLIVNGNLTVFGSAISAFTSQLYVEDPNVIFNYNPSGSTVATSICAGLTIQDGTGISGSSVGFYIQPMNAFTGITPTQIPNITEYTGANGYTNRAWITQLNDIVIRSTTVCPASPNGVRVLAEFDEIDGGSY